MLRLLTAGESHGPKLTAIIDGLPSGLAVDQEFINGELKARQGGFGRSGRQKLESDAIDITGGVRLGYTTGAPFAFEIKNKDHENWLTVMSVNGLEKIALTESQKKQIKDRKIERFRPGHADLAGTIKYRLADVRDVLERASARETAARVAAGAIAENLLKELGVKIASHVVSIGKISLPDKSLANDSDTGAISKSDSDLLSFQNLVRQDPVYCRDQAVSTAMQEHIMSALKEGDSLGGLVEVLVDNVPAGLGSVSQWDRKLDGLLAQALISIQAAKAVEIGNAVQNATLPGSQVHDALYRDEKGESACFHVMRKTNHAGGIEGGMTNGERLVLRVYFKPIPTLKKGLPSLSYPQFDEAFAHYERSDVCAIPAASVVAKAMVSLTLANAFIDKFAADTMQDLKSSVAEYRKYILNLTKGKVDNAP